jgi:site-specific DNA recombinase
MISIAPQAEQVDDALLEAPDELYRRCNDQQRRLLNQTIFHGLYIEDDQVTAYDLHHPFGALHALQHEHVHAPTNATPIRPLRGSSKRATRPAGGPSTSGVTLLLKSVHTGQGSNKNPRVEVPGIEPGSSVASSGLLRAQSAMPLLGSTGPADKPV